MLLPDPALARVDMVLVGAEGVVESGGVINKLGTYQAALASRARPQHALLRRRRVLQGAPRPACLPGLCSVPHAVESRSSR